MLAYLEFPAEFSEVTRTKVIVHLLKEQRRAVRAESREWGLFSREPDTPCPADCLALMSANSPGK